MKKNFLMWFVTLLVALIGLFIAIISFFKNRRFFCCFKNEDDVIPKKGAFDEPNEVDKLIDLDDDLENVDDYDRKIEKLKTDESINGSVLENEQIYEVDKDKYVLE